MRNGIGKATMPTESIETKVPTSSAPGVNSWPTQPIPSTQNVLFNPVNKDNIPCTTTDAVTSTGAPFATSTAPDGKPYKIGCAYDPYDTNQYVVTPFEMMDWPAARGKRSVQPSIGVVPVLVIVRSTVMPVPQVWVV